MMLSHSKVFFLPLLSIFPADCLQGAVGRHPPCVWEVGGHSLLSLLSGCTSAVEIGTLVVTLPGAWHFRVSAGTGGPGVNTL